MSLYVTENMYAKVRGTFKYSVIGGIRNFRPIRTEVFFFYALHLFRIRNDRKEVDYVQESQHGTQLC